MLPHLNPETRRLAPLLGRLRTVRVAGILAGIVAFGFAFTFSIISALTLSPEQAAESELGGFDSVLQLSGFYPAGRDPDTAAIAAAIRAGGGTNPHVAVTVYDLRFTQLPDARRIFFQEMDWQDSPLTDKYTLLSGRYPSAPGEIAVSESVDDIAHTDALTGFGGDITLHVVGTVSDDYQRDATFLLAGPGTWTSWGSIPRIQERYPSLKGGARAYWNGGESSDQLTQWQVRAGALSADEAEATVASSLMTRATLIQRAPGLWLSRFPLILELPLFVIPLLAGLLAGTLNGRWMRGMQVQLGRLGIQTRHTAAALWLTTTISSILASGIGWGAGMILGWASRPPLDAIVDHQLGPQSWLPSEFAIVILGGVLGLVISIIRFPGALKAWRPKLVGESALPWWRRGIGLACGLIFTAQAVVEHDPSTASSMVAVVIAAVCLWIPDVLPVLLRREPNGVLPLTAVRFLRARQRQTSIAVAALGAILALAVSATSIAYSLEETYRRQAIDRVPPGAGQVVAQDEQDGVPELVRSRVESDVGIRNPIANYSLDTVYLENTGPAHAIAVFDDPDALSRWNVERPLTESQRSVLTRGGVLTNTAQQSVALSTGSATVTLLSADIALAPEWAQQFGGAMLRATAQAHGWRMINETLTYTHLTAVQQQALRTVAERNAFDPSYVVYGYPADVQTLPEKYTAALAALTLLNCLIAAAFTTAQGRAARPYLASLSALGVPRRWIGSVVALQVILVLGASLASAALSSALGLSAIFLVDRDHFDPVVPWPSLGLILALTVGGTLIGLAAGMVRLSPRERTMT